MPNKYPGLIGKLRFRNNGGIFDLDGNLIFAPYSTVNTVKLTENALWSIGKIGTTVTQVIDVTPSVGRVAGLQINLKNTGATVTGFRGVDSRVNDDGGTLCNIVGVQAVATKTSGTSTGYDIWGGNFIVSVVGGKVESAYGVVGDLTVGASGSIGTTGAPINYATAGLFVTHIDTSATLATEFVDAAVIGKIDQGTNARKKATGAFVAILGGDSGAGVTAGAAFAVQRHNSTAANKFDYGLDLYYNDGASFSNIFAQADIRLSSGGLIVSLTDAITANTTVTTTAAGTLGKTTNATGRASLFVSDGSKWQFLTNA